MARALAQPAAGVLLQLRPVDVIRRFLLLITAASAAPLSAAVDLADLDEWRIVVAPGAIASEKYAAQEFRTHLALAGGPDLEIVSQAEGPGGHVFIGPGAAMGSPVGFDLTDYGPEDLRIVVRPGAIVVAGGRPRGTLYGVYTFLEDYLGVRFVTADHTHVPPLGPERWIGPVDRVYRPPLEWRWSDFETNYARPDFAARLRLNAGRVEAMPPGSTDWSLVGRYGGRSPVHLVEHSFNALLPPSEYAVDHPEYYCLYEGERWAHRRYEDGRFHEDLQPCMTHPEVLRLITRAALGQLKAHPSRMDVSVAQNDGSVWCQCPSCRALNEREGTPMGSLLTLVNAVADEAAAAHPGRGVSTLAYDYSAPPPRSLRPRDNVLVMWCSIRVCFIHALTDPACPDNAGQYAQLAAWSRIAPNLYVWDYYMNHDRRGFQLPLPNLRWIAENVRAEVDLGVRGLFTQAFSSSHGNEFEDLRNYLLSRLMWDPGLDGRALMVEWLDLHYGPAAPPIRRWIDRLHDRALASGRHRHSLGGRYDEYGLDESDAAAGLEAVEVAMGLADSDAVRRRVEQASIWAWRATLEPVWYATGEVDLDPGQAEELRARAEHFFELCRKHDVRRTASGSWFAIDKAERRVRAAIGDW